MISFSLSRQQLLVGSGLLLLVGLSWWLQGSFEEIEDALYRLDGQPDYYMRDLSLQVVGEGGEVQHHLSARKMAYFSWDDSAHLDTPQVVVYRENRPAWMVESDQGVLYNREQTLTLDNGVSLYRGDNKQASSLQLHTQQMVVDLESEQAKSEGDVLVLQPPIGELSGRGLILDLQQNRLHLMSQVRVRYENR